MNRRIRNRTYGGVGGGPKMPSYPIALGDFLAAQARRPPASGREPE